MCPVCGAVRYAKKGQKTARCFKCGYRITVDPAKTRIIAETKGVQEAIVAVQEYKMKHGKSNR